MKANILKRLGLILAAFLPLISVFGENNIPSGILTGNAFELIVADVDSCLEFLHPSDIGYLRNPSDVDKRFYVFTNQDFIVVKFGECKVKSNKVFDYYCQNGVFLKCSKNIPEGISEGAWEIKNPENGFEFELTAESGLAYKFFVVPCDSLKNGEIRAKIGVCDTILAADTTRIGLGRLNYSKGEGLRIEVNRNRRALITGIELCGKPLDSLGVKYSYLLDGKHQKVWDDIAHINAALEIDSLVLPGDCEVMEMTINFMSFEDGVLVSKSRIVEFIGEKQGRSDNGEVISGLIAILVFIAFIAFVMCRYRKTKYKVKFDVKQESDEPKTVYRDLLAINKMLLFRGKSVRITFGKKPEQILSGKAEIGFNGIIKLSFVTKEKKLFGKSQESVIATLGEAECSKLASETEVDVTIEMIGDTIVCKVGDAYYKEVGSDLCGDDCAMVFVGQETETLEPDNTEPVEHHEEPIFKFISDRGAAQLLKETLESELNDIDSLQADDVKKKIKQLGIKEICELWNENHADPDDKIPTPYGAKRLLAHIEKGYLGKAAKDEIKRVAQKEIDQNGETNVNNWRLLQLFSGHYEDAGRLKAYEEWPSKLEEKKKPLLDEIERKDGEIESLKLEVNEERNKKENEASLHQQKTQEVLGMLAGMLKVLTENNFTVESCEDTDNAQDYIKIIEDSIRKGVDNDAQKIEIEQLKNSLEHEKAQLDSQKESFETLMTETETAHNQELESLKTEHQTALSEKDAEKEGALTRLRTELELECQAQLDSQKKSFETLMTKTETAHNQELESLKTEHQTALSEKDAEKEGALTRLRTELESECQTQLYLQKKSFDTLLADTETTHKRELKSLRTEHQTEIEGKDATISSLNEVVRQKDVIIEEKETEVHSDCKYYVTRVMSLLDEVNTIIVDICDSAESAYEPSPMHINFVENIKRGFERFYSQAQQSAEDKWSDLAIRVKDVESDLQEYIMPGLTISGWVNIANYLNLYAGVTADLNDSFNEKGLDPDALSRLCAEIQRLLGTFGVKIVLPHILTDEYDGDKFDFENADQWISEFSPSLRPGDFESRVFDMSCIGYQIVGKEYVKPVVYCR